MAENLQFWKENKVIGYMAEASTVYPPGSDLHELKTYVTSRLLWNSSRVPLQEISEFLVLYYGKNGAASVKLYMDTIIQSVKAIGYCRADDGRSLGFPPTAPFLTPAAVLTSANGFAKARAIADLSRKHRARVERASLSVNYVVLVRWREMRQYANRTGMPWQLPPTRALAYADWETIANTTEQVLGRGRDSFGDRPLSWYRQQVFNESARDWCLPYEGPEACDFDWVDKQPCCTACGEDQPPRPGSNLCLNDTRLPPSFAAPRYELPAPAAIKREL